jgi:hypothetical protein
MNPQTAQKQIKDILDQILANRAEFLDSLNYYELKVILCYLDKVQVSQIIEEYLQNFFEKLLPDSSTVHYTLAHCLQAYQYYKSFIHNLVRIFFQFLKDEKYKILFYNKIISILEKIELDIIYLNLTNIGMFVDFILELDSIAKLLNKNNEASIFTKLKRILRLLDSHFMDVLMGYLDQLMSQKLDKIFQSKGEIIKIIQVINLYLSCFINYSCFSENFRQPCTMVMIYYRKYFVTRLINLYLKGETSRVRYLLEYDLLKKIKTYYVQKWNFYRMLIDVFGLKHDSNGPSGCRYLILRERIWPLEYQVRKIPLPKEIIPMEDPRIFWQPYGYAQFRVHTEDAQFTLLCYLPQAVILLHLNKYPQYSPEELAHLYQLPLGLIRAASYTLFTINLLIYDEQKQIYHLNKYIPHFKFLDIRQEFQNLQNFQNLKY